MCSTAASRSLFDSSSRAIAGRSANGRIGHKAACSLTRTSSSRLIGAVASDHDRGTEISGEEAGLLKTVIAENAILALQGPGRITAVADSFRSHVRAEITGRTAAWPENAATLRLFEIYARAAAKISATVQAEKRGGLSDGNLLAPHLPTLDGLGPAGGNAHSSEWSDNPASKKRPEYLDPTSLLPKALLNILAIAALAETT